ncbi:hypothetical protein, partial [Sangeribacter muris]|uniref:hypothetical protein n=1 Tax=Sangeribacter muris TaxID=2880703 RepID=UPI00244DF899
PDRKIPRPASRPLETLTKIAAQNPDGFLFMAYLLSRTVVLSNQLGMPCSSQTLNNDIAAYALGVCLSYKYIVYAC